jgi:ubiquinone/menaquinone biosynthesis C-methylase UbiE
MPLTPFSHTNDSSGQENEVRNYYDHNTTMFLKHGEHGKTYGIHQPLYFKKNDSIQTAMHAQHAMILKRLGTGEIASKVLDLGCGIGSSLRYLRAQTPDHVRFTGISISPGQIDLARQHQITPEDQERITFVCASFQQLPVDLIDIDLAFAIESFIHSPDAKVFYQQISKCLKPGGKLIIFDDFLNRQVVTKGENRVLNEFHSGWKANNLHQIAHFSKLANASGLSLSEDIDLTPYLRLGRPRDKAIGVLASFLRILPVRNHYMTFLLGGNARQEGFQQGLLTYRMMVFEKR